MINNLISALMEKLGETDINTDLSNSNINRLDLNLIVVYKRVFGKKLAFLTCINIEKTEEYDVKLNETEFDLISKISIGDNLHFLGEYQTSLGKTHIIPLVVYKHMKSDNIGSEINELRKINCNLSNKTTDEKAVCKQFKSQGKCDLVNCKFKHFLTEKDKVMIEKLQIKQQNMYNLHHADDYVKEEDKKCKSKRNQEFVDFLVNKFGLEYLKTGLVLDIAGGKGFVSYNFQYLYNIESIVVDPRGVTLPKKYKKRLDEKNLFIKEVRNIFDEDNIPSKEIMNKCKLIVGMHPDEATVSIVKVALKYNINFAIVPCCVFPTIFKDRFLNSGQFVVDYTHLISYIEEICFPKKVNTHFLKIEGRNKVLYTDIQNN
jgi:hypothetical protein